MTKIAEHIQYLRCTKISQITTKEITQATKYHLFPQKPMEIEQLKLKSSKKKIPNKSNIFNKIRKLTKPYYNQ